MVFICLIICLFQKVSCLGKKHSRFLKKKTVFLKKYTVFLSLIHPFFLISSFVLPVCVAAINQHLQIYPVIKQ